MQILFTCGDLVTRILNFKLATASNYENSSSCMDYVCSYMHNKVGLSIIQLHIMHS